MEETKRRVRCRHANDLKKAVLDECRAGVSIASVAMAHGINVSVSAWHLEMSWPMAEHRVHGERGGCLEEGGGVGCAPVCPLQAASVERGVCTPERRLICSCR